MEMITTAEKVEAGLVTHKDALTAREREIVGRYYGIRPFSRHTLQEIGDMFGVTRERVRQIKAEALGKLKLKK